MRKVKSASQYRRNRRATRSLLHLIYILRGLRTLREKKRFINTLMDRKSLCMKTGFFKYNSNHQLRGGGKKGFQSHCIVQTKSMSSESHIMFSPTTYLPTHLYTYLYIYLHTYLSTKIFSYKTQTLITIQLLNIHPAPRTIHYPQLPISSSYPLPPTSIHHHPADLHFSITYLSISRMHTFDHFSFNFTFTNNNQPA